MTNPTPSEQRARRFNQRFMNPEGTYLNLGVGQEVLAFCEEEVARERKEFKRAIQEIVDSANWIEEPKSVRGMLQDFINRD